MAENRSELNPRSFPDESNLSYLPLAEFRHHVERLHSIFRQPSGDPTHHGLAGWKLHRLYLDLLLLGLLTRPSPTRACATNGQVKALQTIMTALREHLSAEDTLPRCVSPGQLRDYMQQVATMHQDCCSVIATRLAEVEALVSKDPKVPDREDIRITLEEKLGEALHVWHKAATERLSGMGTEPTKASLRLISSDLENEIRDAVVASLQEHSESPAFQVMERTLRTCRDLMQDFFTVLFGQKPKEVAEFLTRSWPNAVEGRLSWGEGVIFNDVADTEGFFEESDVFLTPIQKRALTITASNYAKAEHALKKAKSGHDLRKKRQLAGRVPGVTILDAPALWDKLHELGTVFSRKARAAGMVSFEKGWAELTQDAKLHLLLVQRDLATFRSHGESVAQGYAMQPRSAVALLAPMISDQVYLDEIGHLSDVYDHYIS